jgi:hypothetical protein
MVAYPFDEAVGFRMKKSTITFHGDSRVVIPYLHRMREEGFPFLRTDLASRAIDNGLYGVGSKRALAHLDWDWNVRFKADPRPQVQQGLSQQRRMKIEVSLMVRDSDVAMLVLMLGDLSYTVYAEPFYQQKEIRRRTPTQPSKWVFPKISEIF